MNEIRFPPIKTACMKTNKSPFKPNILLWWVAIIALAVSGMIFYLTAQPAEYDPAVETMRKLALMVGFVVAGICLIAGTAGRWFYPK